MKKEDIKKEYELHKSEFASLQKEVEKFVNETVERHTVIDIADIRQRPGNKIKSLSSIQDNFKNPDKYQGHTNIFQIKDIAGVRVTCYCEDDLENFATILEGELNQHQEYSDVKAERKGGKENKGKSRPPYRAIHITFIKTVTQKNKTFAFFCEIQIRTVMGDAWAVLDRKYVYGKGSTGEAHDLTDAISHIMYGGDQLWSIVKKKSLGENDKAVIFQLTDKIDKDLVVAKKSSDKATQTADWFLKHKKYSMGRLKKLNINTLMEIKVEIPNFNLNISKKALKDAAKNSTIKTFGWPIGVFINNNENSPKPDPDGIYAEIKGLDWATSNDESGEKKASTYDYWAIHSNGAFYLSKSLFEEKRKPTHIFFNTRIVRITEVFQYLYKLYTHLKVPSHTTIEVTITHAGLKNKILGSSSWNRELFGEYKTTTNKVNTKISTTIDEIDKDIVGIVEKFTEPLFEQFDFFELERKVLEDIVINYINGKTS
mgnify:CR=1 FL=1